MSGRKNYSLHPGVQADCKINRGFKTQIPENQGGSDSSNKHSYKHRFTHSVLKIVYLHDVICTMTLPAGTLLALILLVEEIGA